MATITDVAEHAGVSVGTVSNVINNKPHVSHKTREKVQKVIKELGYSPNQVAQNLRKGITRTIALFVLDFSNPYYSEVIQSVENAAREYGYQVTVFDITYSAEDEESLIKTIKQLRVDGVILTAGWNHDWIATKFPSVLMDHDIKETDRATVGIDNAAAVCPGIEYLLSLGHRDIAYLSEPIEVVSVKKRYEGYRRAFEKYGSNHDPSRVYISERLKTRKMQNGHELMKEIIHMNRSLPTALFATSDEIAIGAMKALQEHGFHIPGDISVMGFDDITFAAFTTPSLTSINQQKRKMGNQAVQLLMQQIEEHREGATQFQLETTLVTRQSTGELSV